MSSVPTYDPKLVVLTLGDIEVTGYAEGSMIEAERDGDSFTKYVGSTGETARVRNRNRTGTVTVHITQTSACNDRLSALQQRDELFGDGVRPLQMVDMGGTTLLSADRAWLRKPAGTPMGNTMGVRDWIIDTADLDVHVGGAW